MKKPDVVLRELGHLYEFYRELAKFRFRDKGKFNKRLQQTAKRRC